MFENTLVKPEKTKLVSESGELKHNAAIAALSSALVSFAIYFFIEKAFLPEAPAALKTGAYVASFVVFFALILIDEAMRRDLCFHSAAAVASLCAVLREISTALSSASNVDGALNVMLHPEFYFTCVVRFAVFYFCLLAARALAKGIYSAVSSVSVDIRDA